MIRRGLLVVLLCAGCAGRPRTPPPPPPLPPSPVGIDRAIFEREADSFLALVERFCGCRDTACLDEANLELARLAEDTTTANDPVTDIETNPPDIHALSLGSAVRLSACLAERRYRPTALAVFVATKIEQFRDAACRCADAACARRVEKAFDNYAAELKDDDSPATDETLARISAAAVATRTCISAPLVQQALLDLEALRTDACACAGSECVADIQARFEAWASENQGVHGTQTETDRVAEVAEGISACLLEAAKR